MIKVPNHGHTSSYLKRLGRIETSFDVIDPPTGDNSINHDLCSSICKEVEMDWHGFLVLEMCRKKASEKGCFKAQSFGA